MPGWAEDQGTGIIPPEALLAWGIRLLSYSWGCPTDYQWYVPPSRNRVRIPRNRSRPWVEFSVRQCLLLSIQGSGRLGPCWTVLNAGSSCRQRPVI